MSTTYATCIKNLNQSLSHILRLEGEANPLLELSIEEIKNIFAHNLYSFKKTDETLTVERLSWLAPEGSRLINIVRQADLTLKGEVEKNKITLFQLNQQVIDLSDVIKKKGENLNKLKINLVKKEAEVKMRDANNASLDKEIKERNEHFTPRPGGAEEAKRITRMTEQLVKEGGAIHDLKKTISQEISSIGKMEAEIEKIKEKIKLTDEKVTIAGKELTDFRNFEDSLSALLKELIEGEEELGQSAS